MRKVFLYILLLLTTVFYTDCKKKELPWNFEKHLEGKWQLDLYLIDGLAYTDSMSHKDCEYFLWIKSVEKEKGEKKWQKGILNLCYSRNDTMIFVEDYVFETTRSVMHLFDEGEGFIDSEYGVYFKVLDFNKKKMIIESGISQEPNFRTHRLELSKIE